MNVNLKVVYAHVNYKIYFVVGTWEPMAKTRHLMKYETSNMHTEIIKLIAKSVTK